MDQNLLPRLRISPWAGFLHLAKMDLLSILAVGWSIVTPRHASHHDSSERFSLLPYELLVCRCDSRSRCNALAVECTHLETWRALVDTRDVDQHVRSVASILATIVGLSIAAVLVALQVLRATYSSSGVREVLRRFASAVRGPRRWYETAPPVIRKWHCATGEGLQWCCAAATGGIISMRGDHHGLWNAGDRHGYALGRVLEVGIHPLSV